MTKIYHPTLRTTLPITRFNNCLQLDADSWLVLTTYANNFVNQNFKHPSILNSPNDQTTRFNADFLSQSFVYLITETVGDYPYPYFSEKTWKAILSSMPFILVGSKHSLKKLHEFGFKTFSQWWSEDYDNCKYVADRIKLITLELKKLCELDYTELEHYRFQMQEILIHNQTHIREFRKNDLENIRAALNS